MLSPTAYPRSIIHLPGKGRPEGEVDMTIHFAKSKRDVLLGLSVVGALMMPVQISEAAQPVSVDFTVQETLLVTTGKTIESNIENCMTAKVKTTGVSITESDGVSTFSGNKRLDCGAGNTFTIHFSAKSVGCQKTDVGTWKVTKGTGVFASTTGEGKLVGTYTLGNGAGTYCKNDGIEDHYTGKLTY